MAKSNKQTSCYQDLNNKKKAMFEKQKKMKYVFYCKILAEVNENEVLYVKRDAKSKY